MKESKNVANLSNEDLAIYRKMCFAKYGSQKFEYATQIDSLNHFLNNKGIWYPLRKELALPKSSSTKLFKTNVIRQILIADRSISVKGDQDEEDSDMDQSESYSSVMLSRNSSASSDVTKTLSRKLKQKINIDEDSLGVDVNLKPGGIQISAYNIQLVIKVLKSLKDPNAPSQIYDFLRKIITNLDGIDFKVPSASKAEKLRQIFFYKVFRYTSFALKLVFQNDDIEAQQLSTPSYKSLPDSGILLTIKSELEKYISSTIEDRISEVLNFPKQNLASVGYIAGLSECIKYLDSDVVSDIVKSLKKNKFLNGPNFNDCLPVVIAIIENHNDKFSDKQKQKMRKIWISDCKKQAKPKSKKLYLALQMLLCKDEGAGEDDKEALENESFDSKAFLNSKPIAKLFIKSFIKAYYSK